MTGDIQITAGDTTYVLNYGSNAACRLEEIIGDGRGYGDVMDELYGPSPKVKTIRAFVKAALVSHPDLTLEQVGDVIDQLGGWALVLVGLESQSPFAAKAKDVMRELENAVKATEAMDAGVANGNGSVTKLPKAGNDGLPHNGARAKGRKKR